MNLARMARCEWRETSTAIKQEGGELRSDPYSFQMTKESSELGFLYRTKDNFRRSSCQSCFTHNFYSTAPAYCMPASDTFSLDSSVNIDELPIVAVRYRRGFSTELEPVVLEHWTPTGAQPETRTWNKRSQSPPLQNTGIKLPTKLWPSCKDHRLQYMWAWSRNPDPTMISNPTMIKRIKEAVLKYKDVTKIFNFSSAGKGDWRRQNQ